MKSKLKKEVNKGRIIQLHVSLNGITPMIWRRLLVKDDIKLSTLSAAILLSMGWNNSHLHDFHIAGKDYGMTGPEIDNDMLPVIPESTVKLNQFPLKDIEQFEFRYDYGDGWIHTVVLEEIKEPASNMMYPVCIAGARAAPLDDCGAVRGYEEILEALKHRHDPDERRQELLAWAGDDYDPERFDLLAVNVELLSNLKKTERTFK